MRCFSNQNRESENLLCAFNECLRVYLLFQVTQYNMHIIMVSSRSCLDRKSSAFHSNRTK